MEEIIFLSLDDVLQIHADQLAKFGGTEGFVDRGQVESAISQPAARMFGEYLQGDICGMAGAYLFFLAASQGFADGNKRTAANCAHAFLQINGFDLECSPEELYDLTMNVANRLSDKADIAEWIRERLVPIVD
jgi:death-on-curing protein